jgi:hypothetical protein
MLFSNVHIKSDYKSFYLYNYGEGSTGYWRESLKERDHLEDQGVDGRMGSERILGWK